ncbi:hypothetical protein SAMN05421505_11059 [Sinosporangium album]|uniref:Uncharacterized protein n=2 Tax=Sinosporangium album TaxID=504805 RepID=A0A1G7YT88_9ACTN|nr:hypothetical protein SAMN05421505_11059 [Sinosporangium album]
MRAASRGRIVWLMSAVETPAAMVADLFDLDAQVGPVHELPVGMDSEDCTSDTCTQTCAGCGGN